MRSIEPKFKQGDRLWSRTYERFCTVMDADLCSIFTDQPFVQYFIRLEGQQVQLLITVEDCLQVEPEVEVVELGESHGSPVEPVVQQEVA